MKKDKSITILVFLLLSSLLLTIIVINVTKKENENLKKFSSYEELQNFLKENLIYDYYSYFQTKTIVDSEKVVATEAIDYSKTNIQVEGVDEADIIKSDGKYIYAVSGDNVFIIDAYPAEEMKIVSKIEFNGTPNEIFVNENKILVIGTEYNRVEIQQILPIRSSLKTFIRVYDISDKTNPILKRNFLITGNYFESRMVDNYAYVIVNEPVYYVDPQPIILPRIYSDTKSKNIPATEIYYFDNPDSSYTFTTILAINMEDDNEDVATKTFLMGYTQNMYVSQKNIYIVYTKTYRIIDFYDRIIDEAILPSLPSDIQNKIKEIKESDEEKYQKLANIHEIVQNYLNSLDSEQAANIMKNIQEKMERLQEEIAKDLEKTIIHKISIENGKIEYKAKGEVPGYVLNQFSMDEYNGQFRIATTTGNWREKSLNHIYVTDENLEIIGKLEDLASGERVYSARFVEDKVYIVTFRQIDPLFVIDLSNPTQPEVLGYLKIPGVSEYLHPYDENHLIGVGLDATEEGRVKGLKLSLFDITDFSNPKELSKYTIGEAGTYSEVLSDHKAFLFSKSKNLLVLPVSLTEENRWNYWQGVYVFKIDLEKGFELKGKITHFDTEKEKHYDYNSQIKRSVYIDDVLYTFSNKMLKANNLEDMVKISSVEFPIPENIVPIFK